MLALELLSGAEALLLPLLLSSLLPLSCALGLLSSLTLSSPLLRSLLPVADSPLVPCSSSEVKGDKLLPPSELPIHPLPSTLPDKELALLDTNDFSCRIHACPLMLEPKASSLQLLEVLLQL